MNNLCCVLTPIWSCRGCGARWCEECGKIVKTVHHEYVGKSWDGTSWDERDYKCPTVGRVKIGRMGTGGWFEP